MAKGKYYTPKEIIDPAAGSGGYLKHAADLLSNPPYSAKKRNRFLNWLRRLVHRLFHWFTV
jgi:type I restriction-modification system DNA methylase subunit